LNIKRGLYLPEDFSIR